MRQGTTSTLPKRGVHACLTITTDLAHGDRAHCLSSDEKYCDVSVAIRNSQVRTSDCQTGVEAHLSRFTFGDISGRIMSKLDL